MNEFNEINKPTTEDIVVGIGKALTGLIPGSSFFTEYWALFLGSPIEKRRNDFFQNLYERIVYLEENNGLDVNSLKENTVFIDSLLQIIPIAQKTSQEEKLEAFRNALSNIATGINIDETQNHIYIRLLDSLTVAHLKILEYLNSPSKWLLKNNMSAPYGGANMMRMLLMVLPQFNQHLMELLLNDLKRSGLIRDEITTRILMNPSQIEVRRATAHGTEFIKFVTFETKNKPDN